MNRAMALVVSTMLIAAGVSAQSPEEKGLAIAQEAKARDSGWKDFSTDVLMVLRSKSGQESKRYLRSRSLEQADDGDKSLVVFDEPRDVKGTALLTHAHKTRPDDQWLYFPALKRVKRIAGANKSGPFMGSEFAYEDLSPVAVEKFRYRYLRDEPLDGQSCFVIERIPEDKNSGYSRQVVWMDQAEYRLQKIEFYDRKNDLLKTLTITGYEQYLDKYWRAESFAVENHQTGKSSEIHWTNIVFGQGLGARDFDVNSLSRIR